MNEKDKILEIIKSTQNNLYNDKLSKTLNDCLRIAMLRNDFTNQWWIKWEFCTITDSENMRTYPLTIQHKFSPDKFQELWTKYQMDWFNERKISDDDAKTLNIKPGNLYGNSVTELENRIATAENSIRGLTSSQNLSQSAAYEFEMSNFKMRTILENSINVWKNILDKIRNRAAEFLNQTEVDMLSGKTYSDIFLRTKEFVDTSLSKIAPEVLQKFLSIELDSNNKETYAQSLITCRRVLKSFADYVYPTLDEPVLCSDGVERNFGDDKYVSRLWQYISENIDKSSSRELILNQLDNLGKRVDYIYSLTNKGVHADVNEQEANQCIVQTYLLIGDILMIKNNA